MQSVYSGSAMYTDNEVTGEIQLGLSYSENEQALNVSINKARGLTAPKDNENSANPYVTMVISYMNNMLCCHCGILVMYEQYIQLVLYMQ